VERVEGVWRTPHYSWRDSVPIPGARDMTVGEMIGDRLRWTRRYGEWIEIDKETASIHADVLTWCLRNCNSQLPSGTFRIAPRVWDARAEDGISYPYIPALDDPSATIRDLAEAELFRRQIEVSFTKATATRTELIRRAGAEGHSRRRLARLLGLSFGRIQQLTQP
jgi:hypothetical protein